MTGRVAAAPTFRRGPAFARTRFHQDSVRSFAARPVVRGSPWPGPFFWSYATDDVFWPTAYDGVFWTYGASDVLVGILVPGSYERFAHRASRRGSRAARALAPHLPDGSGLCRDQPAQLANIAAIDQEVRPTREQRAAFDELQAAEAKAVEVMRAACPRDIPPSPIGRLDAMAEWVDAVLEAVHVVRTPLERFYGSLDDEQRARFAVLASSGPRADAGGQWLDSCSNPRGFAGVPTDRVARRLRLSEPQLAALEDFSAASDEAARKIRQSCPREMPLTPTGRIAAIEQRLATLRDALGVMRLPLEAFYGSLSDEQKAHFERIGSRPSRRAG
jgi:LTXXQ motif family protein